MRSKTFPVSNIGLKDYVRAKNFKGKPLNCHDKANTRPRVLNTKFFVKNRKCKYRRKQPRKRVNAKRPGHVNNEPDEQGRRDIFW